MSNYFYFYFATADISMLRKKICKPTNKIIVALLRMFHVSSSDRRQGAELNHQFEDAQLKLEDYIQGVERVIKERAALIDLLAMTEHFFELQYGEAKVVANVSR
jgi:hypothetical protein